MSVQVQLHSKHNMIHGRGSKGRLLRSGSSQAVKQSSCPQAATTSAAYPTKSAKAFQLTVISYYGTLLSIVQRSAFLLQAWCRNKSLAYSSGVPSWPRIPWLSSEELMHKSPQGYKKTGKNLLNKSLSTRHSERVAWQLPPTCVR